MQYYKISNLKETVIILNDRENTDRLLNQLKKENGKIYSFADNFILDKISELGISVNDIRKAHNVEKSSFVDKLQNYQNEEKIKGKRL